MKLNENVTKFENELCDFFPNEVSMEKEPLVEVSKENPNLQIEIKSTHERHNSILRTYMWTQRVLWKPHNEIILCWVVYCVNENKEMDGKTSPIMCCMFYYNSPIDAYSLVKIQPRKGIIYHIINYWNTDLEKTYGCKPIAIAKKFQEELNSPMKRVL